MSGLQNFSLRIVAIFSLIFFFSDSHLGLLLVQLEFLSLFILIFILTKTGIQTSIVLISLLCLVVSEAALGLSLLVLNSRGVAQELHKFSL